MDNSHILNSQLQVFPLSTHTWGHTQQCLQLFCVQLQLHSREVYQRRLTTLPQTDLLSQTKDDFNHPCGNSGTPKKKLITELLKGILLWLYSPFSIFHRVFVEYSLCLYGPFTDTEKYWGNLKCFYSNLWNSSIRPWEMSSCSKLYSIFLLYFNWNILIHLHDSTALFLGHSFSHRKSAMSKAQPASALRT